MHDSKALFPLTIFTSSDPNPQHGDIAQLLRDQLIMKSRADPCIKGIIAITRHQEFANLTGGYQLRKDFDAVHEVLEGSEDMCIFTNKTKAVKSSSFLRASKFDFEPEILFHTSVGARVEKCIYDYWPIPPEAGFLVFYDTSDIDSREHGVSAVESALDLFFTHLNVLCGMPWEGSLLQLNDLKSMPATVTTGISYEKVAREWAKIQKLPISKRSLLQALWDSIDHSSFARAIILFLLMVCCNFAGPLILRVIINSLVEGEESEPDLRSLWVMVCSMFLIMVMGSICFTQGSVMFFRIGTELRNGIMVLVYRKIRMLNPLIRQSAVGTISNILVTDIQEIQNFFHTGTPGLFSPIQLGISIALIYRELGVTSLVVVGYTLVAFAVVGIIIGKFIVVTKKKMIHSDNRLKVTSDLFENVKTLKYYAWELAFGEKVKKTRQLELLMVENMHCWNSFVLFIVESIPRVGLILLMVTYVGLGQTLTASKCLTIITLLFLVLSALLGIPLLLISMSKVFNALNRISHLLNEDEMRPYIISGKDDWPYSVQLEDVRFRCTSNMEEYVHDESNVFQETKDSDASMNLPHTLNMLIPRGQLVAIVGPVGCGKTTLLKGLLGELHCASGNVTIQGSIAYHQQNPWILNATVLENIILDQPLDQIKLDKVLEASALYHDLWTLPAGLDTEIGEKGVNLSGGQKARISFARVLYREADVNLLDDPLAAVDSSICELMFHKGLKDFLGMKKRTTLLVTHQVHLLSECDLVVLMNHDGSIRDCCKFEELNHLDVQVLLHDDLLNDDFDIEDGVTCMCFHNREVGTERIEKTLAVDKESLKKSLGAYTRPESAKLMEEEQTNVQMASYNVCMYFFEIGGRCFVWTHIMFRCIAQISGIYAYYTLANLSDNNAQQSSLLQR